MKKRGKIAVTIVLLLAITALATLSTSNPPTIFPNSPPNHINLLTKSYNGSGDQLDALLYITNNYNNTWNDTDINKNIYVPCPLDWKIVWANLTLSNITAPNTIFESNYSNTNASLDLDDLYAMSFQLTNDAYLENISVQLYVKNPPSPTANFYLYNAENNGGKPRPLNQIKSITGVLIPDGTNWVNVDFGHQFLNTSETYDNTFFIAITKNSGTRTPEWIAVEEASPPAFGYAYYYDGSNWLENQSYDCQLVVNVSDIVLPSEIGLTINGSPVSDVSKGNGIWINSNASPVSNGYIFYDADSTSETVSFSYVWNTTYAKNSIGADTNFVVDYNGDAFWNVTVNAIGGNGFPQTDNGINHINITGFPPDWGNASSKAYNGSQWFDLDSYPPNTISFSASNGTWIVNCTAPNYVSDIGFEVDGVPVENATLYDILNITVNFDASVTGTVNLRIYDPSQILNQTEEKPVSFAAGTWFIWDVSDNATSTGMYHLTVSFKNGLLVGYNETLLEIVPLTNTSLTVTGYPSDIEYPGPVPITLYYNRTDTGQGLPGADIAAYFVNSTPATILGSVNDQGNGYYSFDLDFGTDFAVHDVYFNASGLRLFESNVSSPVSINYTRELVSITIGFEVGGVPVENATVDDTLNITVTFDSSVSGTVNLSIYDPSQILNYTDIKTVTSATSTWFTWNISDTASFTGNYSFIVSFNGELAVGHDNETFEIVPLKPAALAVTNYNEYAEYPDTIPITIFYSDSGTGQGLAGAVITAYEGSEILTIYNFTDYGNGTYSFILDFGTDFGVHDVYFSAKLQQYDSSFSSPISINYKEAVIVVVNPLQAGLVSMMLFTMTQQNRTLMFYSLILALLGSAIATAYGTNKWRRRLLVPDRALASLENIIVDHAPTGITLWAFDFLKMETDVTLLSGFMSAVKSFIGEMYKGGLKKLETEFVTFIREEGELLTATCITSGNTPEEEKWIRQRLRSFLFDAEQQHWDALQNWRGDASIFRGSFLEILSVVIDLDKAEKVQMDRVSKIKRKREMLQSELKRLEYQLETLKRQFEAEEISEEDFEVRKAEIEQKYAKVQGEYIDTSLFLSKIPSTLEAKLITPNSEKTVKMQKKLLKIRMEIEELKKKEREGKITTKDAKRKKKLQKELMTLIEKPDKLQENNS